MKVVIYTAVFGRRDTLKDPRTVVSGVDMLCFTDMHYKAKAAYKMVKPSLPADMHRVHKQRRIKIFWPDILDKYDYSLYIDSNAVLLTTPQQLLSYLKRDGADIFAIRHAQRSSVYAEAKKCRGANLISRKACDDVIARYQAEGYPDKAGLYVCYLVFRRHTEKVKRFSEDWWKEFQITPRDQISFPYVAWKHGLKIATMSSKQGARDVVYRQAHNLKNPNWGKA